MAEQALSDIKVVDLSQNISGPYCTKLLADYGAEVIKIEKPDGGDPARRLGPFPGDIPHPEKSGTFLHLNTNKKGITLNLHTPTGMKILKALVKEADILVESFPPRESQELGLSYEEMEKVNPRLVMTSISNFGQTGPYRDYKMSEITLYATGGAMISTGLPDQEPLRHALTVIQFQVGNVAAVATLGALWGVEPLGEGQHVDVSAIETQMSTMDRRAPNLVAYVYSGEPSTIRSHEYGQSILPSGIFFAKDGYVQFSVNNPAWWPRMAKMFGMPELVGDPRFATLEDFYNPERKGDFDAIFYPWLLEHTKREVMDAAQEAGVAAMALNTIADIIDDPQYVERRFWVEIDHPMVGTLSYTGAPFKMMETPWRAGRAPLLGEHNEEIYCGRLGYSRADLVRLRELGII